MDARWLAAQLRKTAKRLDESEKRGDAPVKPTEILTEIANDLEGESRRQDELRGIPPR